MKVTDQIRRIMDKCGMSRYALAKATGIDESTLSRFYNGERGLSYKALDALGEVLDLEIRMRRKPKPPKAS